jgi:hypothetical protein
MPGLRACSGSAKHSNGVPLLHRRPAARSPCPEPAAESSAPAWPPRLPAPACTCPSG